MARKVSFFGDPTREAGTERSLKKYLSDRSKRYSWKDKVFKADPRKRRNYVERCEQAYHTFVDKLEQEEIQAIQTLIQEGKTAYRPRFFGSKKKTYRSYVMDFEFDFNQLIS